MGKYVSGRRCFQKTEHLSVRCLSALGRPAVQLLPQDQAQTAGGSAIRRPFCRCVEKMTPWCPGFEGLVGFKRSIKLLKLNQDQCCLLVKCLQGRQASAHSRSLWGLAQPGVWASRRAHGPTVRWWVLRWARSSTTSECRNRAARGGGAPRELQQPSADTAGWCPSTSASYSLPSSPTWAQRSLELRSLGRECHSFHLCGESFLPSQNQELGPPALGSLRGPSLQPPGRLEVPQGLSRVSSKLVLSIYNCFIK